MYYSLFVFRFYYKIIGLSFLNLAGRGLAGRGRSYAFLVYTVPREMAKVRWMGVRQVICISSHLLFCMCRVLVNQPHIKQQF